MTLNATNLKEEIYVVCTTIYFGYLPTANMTWSTVEPQAAHTLTPTKTPEQLRAEAEQSGWLQIWHEFTWWPPFYIMHVVGVFEGENLLDVGLVLLGCDIIVPSSMFNSWINEFMKAIVKSIAIGYITAELAVLVAMKGGPAAFAVALVSSVIVKATLIGLTWGSVEGLKSAFISAWTSLILGTFGTIKMVHSGVISVVGGIIEAAKEADLWKFPI